jgi:hypothetical protein
MNGRKGNATGLTVIVRAPKKEDNDRWIIWENKNNGVSYRTDF